MKNQPKPTLSTVYFLKGIDTILYEGRRWEMYDASAEGIRYVSKDECLNVIYHIIPLDQFNQLLDSLRQLKQTGPLTIDKAEIDGAVAYFRNFKFEEK